MRLLLLALTIICCVGCERRRTPTHYEIPKGYKGWAFVLWNRAAAAPLPVESGHIVVRFSSDGVVQTSSSELDGWATDEFYWVALDGSLEPFGKTGTILINGQGGGTRNFGSSPLKYSYLYIGSDYSPTFSHDRSLERVLAKIYTGG